MRSCHGFRLLVVVVLVSCAVTACGRKLKMRYDQRFQRLVHVLSPGDEIEWDGIRKSEIAWDFNADPCDPAETKTCKIARGTGGKIFSYKCPPQKPCDPEIAVDEGSTLTKLTVAGGASATAATVAIKVGCVATGTGLEFKDERPLRAGDVVAWRPIGMADPQWSVSFSDQQTACGNTSPINQDGGNCTVKADVTYTFKLTNNCQKTADSQLVVH